MRPSPAHGVLAFIATALLLTACASRPVASTQAPAAAPWRDARQLVLVEPADWNTTTAMLRRFERTRAGGAWQAVGVAQPVVLGRSGSAWGVGLHPMPQADGRVKREGDGRSPAGVFAIGQAFGKPGQVATGLAYSAMTPTHYCMDVPDSPLYNRIVDAAVVGPSAVRGSSERMRLDLVNAADPRYLEGFVIQHNPQATPGLGSCIFAHLWKAPDSTTAGCTAMTEDAMTATLAWLRSDARPVFVLLPSAQYRRLAAAWELPAP